MKALLFDLDGTLIDSMPHHQSAWDAWYARRHGGVGGAGGAGVHQTPCFSEASMKASRSPSSTFCVAEISTLVRRSLMRLLSST